MQFLCALSITASQWRRFLIHDFKYNTFHNLQLTINNFPPMETELVEVRVGEKKIVYVEAIGWHKTQMPRIFNP